MGRSIKGVYRNGVIELEEKVPLKEDFPVTVIFEDEEIVSKKVVEDEREKAIKVLHEIGLIKDPHPILKEAFREEHEPLRVKGEPVSQTIIKNRGEL